MKLLSVPSIRPFCLRTSLGVFLLSAAAVLPASGQDVWVDFTTDFHNGSNGAPNGVADLANPTGNPRTVPQIATGNFNGSLEPGRDSLAQIITEISNSLGVTAAHELGHSLGLFHHFVYSAQDITPGNLSNTGGLQNQHVIGTELRSHPRAQLRRSPAGRRRAVAAPPPSWRLMGHLV